MPGFPAAAVAAVLAFPLAAQLTTSSVRQGVYTDGQAARGSAVYVTQCAECHGTDLGGLPFDDGTTPALRRKDFMAGRTLKDVFDQTKRSMPKNAPASLRDGDYLDVIAFLLRENGYPSGTQELANEREFLKSVVLPK